MLQDQAVICNCREKVSLREKRRKQEINPIIIGLILKY